ncbi:ABC transporter permease [Leptolyngbya sp. FACHB-711]|uniref:ABC transporter permease n=1 Tax=unclassified Leptolyngbya TaxID=2650499 RepID=UPI00168742E4|nr:ABC transporter permease [Leptolyngbya sp. FACHB-711]MBD1850404.1 ABC transporter permease [Cyanobacteria bacterium FACHB-502]MBD2026067.1 ABC transporter permease [Leptolyngbya sp. FACHB-711]
MPKLSQSTVYQASAIVLSLLFIAVVIVLVGGSPIEVLTNMFSGAFSTSDQVARVVMTLVPLVLCTCGLLFTFTAGLYNLGIEGQISFGAIASMVPIQLFQDVLPPFVVIVLAIGAGIVGGALWGLLTGILNVYGRINEIFAGLGLNFVADGLAIYLIFGPWKRPGVASMSGTEQFSESLWLPTFGSTGASPIALILALLVLAATIVVMRGTYFGLKLKAVGQNLRASYVLGIPSIQQLLSAFAICGACAGLAGALQVLAVFHRLIPTVSSNLGYLSLLIAMLIGSNAWLILPIGFFFSALNIGSLQLPLALDLESSLSGVIQGTIVLFALLGRGFSQRKQSPTQPTS